MLPAGLRSPQGIETGKTPSLFSTKKKGERDFKFATSRIQDYPANEQILPNNSTKDSKELTNILCIIVRCEIISEKRYIL